jgi:predicted Zn-ribbon and HTH transcriptional regulator
MYNKEINLTAYNQGYKCFYDKEHPLSTTDGRVFYHRHIMSVNLGRWISKEEQVHHIDGNKENNEISNLELLSASEHAKKHHLKTFLSEGTCAECGTIFSKDKITSIYCSSLCSNINNIKNRDLTKELLDSLIPKYTWISLGEMFGYSDTGIKKRAKALGCNIPIRRKTKPL